ncbi:amino acid transporter [Staphylococcus saprophyticus]
MKNKLFSIIWIFIFINYIGLAVLLILYVISAVFILSPLVFVQLGA